MLMHKYYGKYGALLLLVAEAATMATGEWSGARLRVETGLMLRAQRREGPRKEVVEAEVAMR